MAGLCVLQRRGTVEGTIGDLDQVARIVDLLVLMNSGPGLNQRHLVVDGASSLLLSLFGDRGAHVRSSVDVGDFGIRHRRGEGGPMIRRSRP
jgi:hypothetical protein